MKPDYSFSKSRCGHGVPAKAKTRTRTDIDDQSVAADRVRADRGTNAHRPFSTVVSDTPIAGEPARCIGRNELARQAPLTSGTTFRAPARLPLDISVEG